MESATLICVGQSQPKWVFGIFEEPEADFLSNREPSWNVSSPEAEKSSDEATFGCDHFDRPNTPQFNFGCIEDAEDEPESFLLSANMYSEVRHTISSSSDTKLT